MSRHPWDGAHRNLVGVKVSDDMVTQIHKAALDAGMTTTEWGRMAFARVLADDRPRYADWERRAHEATRALSGILAIAHKALAGDDQ